MIRLLRVGAEAFGVSLTAGQRFASLETNAPQYYSTA